MRELCPAAGGHWRWFPVDALARSILFLAATAEEKGLLGSDYFAHFPTVPIKSIVADINMDGASVLYTFNDIIALGAPDSSLDAVVARNAPPGIESNSRSWARINTFSFAPINILLCGRECLRFSSSKGKKLRILR